MKKWLAAMFAAGVFFVGGFGQASAADWYYIDADADDAAWFIDNSSVYKTDDAATVLVKINNVEGFTYIYTVRIDRIEKTWTELDTTVYSASGVALLSSKDAQKPTKIEVGFCASLLDNNATPAALYTVVSSSVQVFSLRSIRTV